MKRNKLNPLQHETLIGSKCTERGCPFPCESGLHTCMQHTRVLREPQRFIGQSTLEACQIAWFGVATMTEK